MTSMEKCWALIGKNRLFVPDSRTRPTYFRSYPLQMLLLLSQPGQDFNGGRFFTIARGPEVSQTVFASIIPAPQHVVLVYWYTILYYTVSEVDGRKQEANLNCGDLLIFRTSCKHGCTLVRPGT